MANNYRIDLGISLNQGDLGKIKTQLNNFQNQKKINLEINRTKIDNQLNSIRKQIRNLSNIKIDLGKNSGNNSLSFNTEGLDESLKEVASSIKVIKNALGTLDDGGEMKSLLTSVNQISTALDKASGQFAELNAQLNSLAKKDFSVNIGLNMGKSASQRASEEGDIKRGAITQLKQQARALEDYLDQYYKITQQGAGAAKLMQGTKIFRDYWELSPNLGNTSNSLKQQVSTYKQYIDLIQQAAKIKGIDLSSVTTSFSKTTNEIEKEVRDVSNGVKETEEQLTKLKNIFGGGIDSESLNSIVNDLNEIRTILQGLSQNNAIDGLTQSFNKLSETLDKLMTNAKLFQDVLGGVGTGANAGVGSELERQAQQAQQSANAVVQAEERKQQEIQETANEIKQLSNVTSKLNSENVVIQVTEKGLDEAENKITKLTKFDDKGKVIEITTTVSQDFKEVENDLKRLKTLTKEIGNSKIKLEGLDVSKNINQINQLEKELNELQSEYDELYAKSGGKLNQSQLNGLTQVADKMASKLEETKNKMADIRAELAKPIQAKLADTGAKGFAHEIQVANNRAKQFKGSSEGLTIALKQLDTAMEAVKNASVYDADDINGAQRLVEANKEYAAALMNVNSQLSKLEYAQKQSNSSDALTTARNNALLRLKSLFEDNSEAAKRFASDVDRIQRELNECGNIAGINVLNRQINNLGLQIKQAGLQTETFGSRIKKQFSKYLDYFSVASVFMYVEQGLRSMFEQVKLIDSAMTELKKVTNETDGAYDKFLTNAADRAREIGTTIDGLVSSTADFARLGYGFEDAQGLAEVANIYAVVGDEIEGVEGATESLISTMAAFKGEMNGMSNTDFAMSIIDKFNEIKFYLSPYTVMYM